MERKISMKIKNNSINHWKKLLEKKQQKKLKLKKFFRDFLPIILIKNWRHKFFCRRAPKFPPFYSNFNLLNHLGSRKPRFSTCIVLNSLWNWRNKKRRKSSAKNEKNKKPQKSFVITINNKVLRPFFEKFSKNFRVYYCKIC